MASYSDIRGYRVKYLSSDPTLNTSTEGQVWYNSTSGTLKSLVKIKAWQSGANVPTNIRNHMGTGPSTAGVLFGGYNPPATAITTALEYSGYSYSTGGTINTPSRSLAGSGASQTSALKIMGQTEPFSIDAGITNTESYDGSTWTTVNPANTKRFQIGGAGTQTSSIVLGGRDDPANRGTSFEEYDGTSWAAGTSPPLSKSNTGVWGNTTSALVFGGNTPAIPPGTNQNTAQDWNGTAWTSVSDMINRAFNNASNCGDSGSGVNANSTGSEEWDGQTWSTIPAMTSARNGCGGGDNSNIWIGGAPPGLNLTEEYHSSIDNYSPSSQDAWSAGGNMNTAREGLAGFGIQTSAIAAGGETTVAVGTTESYNGSGWASESSMNTANRAISGAGTATAGVVFGGFPANTNTENWNGTAWTASGTLNTGRYGLAGAGEQTAALAFGGGPGIQSATEAYNGTSWTTVTSLNTARVNSAGAGSTGTAVIAFGGYVSSPPTVATTATESWNGSAWTTLGGTMNTARYGHAAAGTQTAALTFGGVPVPGPARTGATESWNGTSWTTTGATLATARTLAGAGTQTAALGFGGSLPPVTNATEEYTPGSPASPTGAAASTLTTS